MPYGVGIHDTEITFRNIHIPRFRYRLTQGSGYSNVNFYRSDIAGALYVDGFRFYAVYFGFFFFNV